MCNEISQIRNRLIEIEKEKRFLLARLEQLNNETTECKSGIPKMSPQEKIHLFRSLFKGRNDVYANKWYSSKTNKYGYSPAKEFDGNYSVLTDDIIKYHLQGQNPKRSYNRLIEDFIVGIYPLLQNETCFFLALDFDDKISKQKWQKDVTAFIKICNTYHIPAYVERSSSGCGAHIWIFFEEAISAYKARKLGSFLITKTMDEFPEIGFKSYDRLFPNQDTMPKGGFGNLIALPLQYNARKNNNTVFINDKFEPYQNQWEFLSKIKKIREQEVDNVLRQDDGLNLKNYILEENADTPWIHKKKIVENFDNIEKPSTLKITLNNAIYIPKENLHPKIINKILKLASFHNPEFYKAQRLRFSTYNIPRIISCAEILAKYITIPRGCLNDLNQFLSSINISVEYEDTRIVGKKLNVSFKGKLTKEQKIIVKNVLTNDIGILSASTGFGKTITALNILAKRKTNTLILVHRKQLLEQWLEKINTFLNTKDLKVGILGNGKAKLNGKLDIAMLQTLSKRDDLQEILSNYGQIVIDECHHIAAFSFENVVKNFKGGYVLAMSATPQRQDGLEPIIYMQCGSIIEAEKDLGNKNLNKNLYIRNTNFQFLTNYTNINEVYKELIINTERNNFICEDVKKALYNKKSCIILTERKEHVNYFKEYFSEVTKNLIVLTGNIKNKERQNSLLKLSEISQNEEILIIATGRYLGEGFDISRLDTMFLTMPFSWKGSLTQYVGRLNRKDENKTEIAVYDYVDNNVEVLKKMFKKRELCYKALGFITRIL